jgi:hypothetical protein
MEFSSPIVIFHAPNFDKSSIKQVRELIKSISDLVTFVEIDLTNYINYANHIILKYYDNAKVCGGVDAESRAASMFFMYDAVKILHDMGYDWYFRFADDSKLHKKIEYNLFQYLHINSKKYAHNGVLRGSPQCDIDLWKTMNSICDKNKECSKFYRTWTPNVIIYTNFEISHYSVWSKKSYKELVEYVTTGYKTNTVEKQSVSSALFWGDAAIHTAHVIYTLRKPDVHKFNDIEYSAQFHVNASESVVENKGVITETLRPLTHYDEVFTPRRFGWLGGDVAVSFLLPDLTCIYDSDNNKKSCDLKQSSTMRYIWLFGDTIVGTSSPTR